MAKSGYLLCLLMGHNRNRNISLRSTKCKRFVGTTAETTETLAFCRPILELIVGWHLRFGEAWCQAGPLKVALVATSYILAYARARERPIREETPLAPLMPS
jgi:hypothetical protein